jgi:hypothetical protein
VRFEHDIRIIVDSLETRALDAFHARWAAAAQRRDDSRSALAQTLSNGGAHLASTDNSNRQRIMIRYAHLDAPRVLSEAGRLWPPIRRLAAPRQTIFLNGSAGGILSRGGCASRQRCGLALHPDTNQTAGSRVATHTPPMNGVSK